MIRRLLLRFLITGIAFFTVTRIIPGIVYTGGYVTLLQIVGVFFLANLFLKPIIKILTLPMEIATLGLLSIFVNAAVLWLVSLVVDGFRLTTFWFSGFHGTGFVIAPLELPIWMTAVIGALLISFISTVLYWLTKG